MSRTVNKSLAILVPALNEELSILKTLREIPSIYDHLIVIDNGSNDKTYSLAQQEGAVVLSEPRKGYGFACLAGIRYLSLLPSPPDEVAFLDADGSDDPKNIILLREIKNKTPGTHMVMGARMKYMRHNAMAPHAVVANKVLVTLIALLYRVKLQDMGPLRIIDYKVLKSIKMQDTGYGWSSEMIVKCLKNGYTIREVDVSYRPRIGESKISGSKVNSFKAAIWLTIHIFKNSLR